jgi:predicted GIY-YIG superfamily endonuclease/proteasome lid subunit RPN8/RPN11
MPFWAYMLHCNAGRFYTGHTDDLERRVAQHKAGHFAGFTRNYLPVELVWAQEFPTRYEAKTAEVRIKGWSRAKKLALVRGDWGAISRLAKKKGSPSTSSGQAEIGISPQALAAMRAHAAAAHPQEACGILLGEGNRITEARPAANVHLSPHTHFAIDPQALIDAHRAARAGGPEVIGYYHSHPRGPAAPSATDRAEASGDGRVWAIIAPHDPEADIRFWRDGEAGFTALPFTMIDG